MYRTSKHILLYISVSMDILSDAICQLISVCKDFTFF